MKTSYAVGRRAARTPKGPAKVIQLSSRRPARRSRRLKAGAGLLALALGAGVAAHFYLTRWIAPSLKETAALAELESELFKLVNQERARRGQKPLRLSARLTTIARAHSHDMAVGHYRSYDTPEGASLADRVKNAGIDYKKVAQNIYVDGGDLRGFAGRAIKGWLESREYRGVLLSPDFDRTGIGIARSSDGHIYVTQDLVR
jgi:uncharacterized protein YkwD